MAKNDSLEDAVKRNTRWRKITQYGFILVILYALIITWYSIGLYLGEI